MDSGLVAAARAGIDLLLDLLGVDIELIPGKLSATEKPSGGYDFTPAAAREPQRFRLISQSPRDAGRTDSESGVTNKTSSYILLGRHDSVADVGDYWIDGNNRYTISDRLVANEYKKEFAVQAHGLGPNPG